MSLGSIVRDNLMKREGYKPFCGNDKCTLHWPRTEFNGKQFVCKCGWSSNYETSFIETYKKVWKIKS